MALAAGSIFAVQASATTGNVNGSGFNPASANFLTDLAATVGTTSAPSVTSASYTFVSGDINSWVYIQSGTNWIPGWYQITNVIAGAAILNATIGAAVLSINAQGLVTYNTSAGCVTGSYVSGTASGTYGVDYSQNDTAIATSTTATSSGAGSVILFAGSTASMLGNFVQIISGTNATAGWYEIIAESVGVSITTDRASTTGVGASITMNIGGAGRLNGAENTFQAMLPASAIVFVKNGSYTLSGAISTASTNGVALTPVFWIGFNSGRGDTCNGANRPTIAAGANAVQFSQHQVFNNFSFTTTAANGINSRVGNQFINCKVLNSSGTPSRNGFIQSAGGGPNFLAIASEAICQNGWGFNTNNSGVGTGCNGCYAHDSVDGFRNGGGGQNIFINNISESNTGNAVNTASFVGTGWIFENNTIIGRAGATPGGTGINASTSNQSEGFVANNIIVGLATGITGTTATGLSSLSMYNNFYNNTTDVTLFTKGATDLALNPSFTNMAEVSGTVGQGLAGQKLQDTTQNFVTAGVVANQDFVHIVSGGTLTAGCYQITAITTTTNPNDTLTLNNNPGTGAASGVYWITTGHNMTPTNTSLIGTGFPNFTNTTGTLVTSYPTFGAVVKQVTASGTGTGFFIQ